MELLYDLLALYVAIRKRNENKKNYTQMLMVALFIIATSRNDPKYPVVDQLAKKYIYILSGNENN